MDHTAVENSALQSWAQISPLLAALIAPMTSLLDIPALTACKIRVSCILGLPFTPIFSLFQQHWYSKYGFPQPDPAASIVLSAVSLGLNLLANVLLVLRFSATARYWHLATVMSLLCWFLKVSIVATNTYSTQLT
jgi:potassium channel subfamily K